MEMYHIIRCLKKIPRKFALRNRKMHVFSLIFIPSFPFCTILTLFWVLFFGLGGGVVMTPLIPMELWRKKKYV